MGHQGGVTPVHRPYSSARDRGQTLSQRSKHKTGWRSKFLTPVKGGRIESMGVTPPWDIALLRIHPGVGGD